MTNLELKSNPEAITSTELFEACIAYNRIESEYEIEKANMRITKKEFKQAKGRLLAYEGKNMVVQREDTDDKVDLFWERKETKGNPEPKPTEGKIKFIPRVKTVEKA